MLPETANSFLTDQSAIEKTTQESSITQAANWTNSSSDTACSQLQFGDFIPWNNPDNIMPIETEDFMRMLKDLVFLPPLFLFSCPANIINMIVFYKQGLKDRINVCLFALSLADELYMVNNMLWFGEQLHVRFTTKDEYGPVMQFFTNYNLLGCHGFIWVSQVLSAIIASERCFCILHPLRSQTVLSTSTMTGIIIAVNVIIVGIFFLVVTRYRVQCLYDPSRNKIITATVPSDFFRNNEQLIIYLDAVVFGAGLPGLVMIVVVSTTIITTIKLRQAVEWRIGSSSASGNVMSQREIGLTKMLVANSAFFLACVFPFVVFRFVFIFMPEVNNGRRQHNFYMFIQWFLMLFSYLNATFNFVVYYTMGSRFRQTFWEIFGRKVRKDTAKKPVK